MTVERREEHFEVVSYDPADLGPVGTGGQVTATAYHTETVSRDPFAARRGQIFKFQQVIYLLFGLLEGLLGIRFVLGLLGANPAAGFAQMIYGLTGPFIAPFVGLFGQPSFEGYVFEGNSLAAILVYALVAWVLVKVVVLLMGENRRGIQTATSTRIDRV